MQLHSELQSHYRIRTTFVHIYRMRSMARNHGGAVGHGRPDVTRGRTYIHVHIIYTRLIAIADLLSLKRDVPYCSLMGWLRCKLSFATLRSAVMCIRGSRSSRHHAVRDSSDTVLVCAEGWNPSVTVFSYFEVIKS